MIACSGYGEVDAARADGARERAEMSRPEAMRAFSARPKLQHRSLASPPR
jgi:hypothetical protein